MENFEGHLEGMVKRSYVNQGLQNERARQNQLQILLNQKKLPVVGWSDQAIEMAINELSIMDSNNFYSNAGVGEREGRVFSSLVAKRHFNLSHGIGRSGDVAEVQPKAAGSSIIYKLTNYLITHAMELAGLNSGMTSLVLPMATGMSLTMCFVALKKSNPTAKYIIWPRIDQKSCFKSISTAGMTPLCVENILVDGKMTTDVASIRSLLQLYGDQVLCVLSTTSCFAPRQPDLIDEIAMLCKEFSCGHVINNAYGVQCSYICKKINRAITIGRVDGVVQSTDKNFMVPVGGAVVMSPNKAFVDAVSGCYPGRASMTPILDLFITLLSMGQAGYRRLLQERVRIRADMLAGLRTLCDRHGLLVLDAPNNSISTAISLEGLLIGRTKVSSQSGDVDIVLKGEEAESVGNAITSPVSVANTERLSYIGSMLFQRCVSGCRVVTCTGESKKVAGMSFMDWGSHINAYQHSYFTVACSVGVTDQDIVLFLERLEKVMVKFKKQNASNDMIEEHSKN